MAAEVNDPPIIITGGSVHLQFDANSLPGGGGKHSHSKKRIKHVTIEKGGKKLYDDDVPDGNITVTVIYGDKKP